MSWVLFACFTVGIYVVGALVVCVDWTGADKRAPHQYFDEFGDETTPEFETFFVKHWLAAAEGGDE